MSRPVMLENFDTLTATFTPEILEAESDRQDRLAAYDEGYGAGWDDGAAATRSELEDADAALRSHLQDLGFTFHEARAHVMRAVQPLLGAILSRALPKILNDTIGHRILADLTALIDDVGQAEITLLVPAGQAGRVAELLADITSLPVEPTEDPGLGDGEFHLRLGADAERQINLDALDQVLADAFAALDTLNKETLAHG